MGLSHKGVVQCTINRGRIYNRARILFILSIFITFILSSCITKGSDGLYRYTIGNPSTTGALTISSPLKSELKKLEKYSDIQRAFLDTWSHSLPYPPNTLKSYTIEPYTTNSESPTHRIQIKLDCSSENGADFIKIIAEVSDKYECERDSILKLPQSLIDHYKEYLDELLSDPEFVALSKELRSKKDEKILAEKRKREVDEVKAKELGFPSVEAYYAAASRQTYQNFANNMYGNIYDAIPIMKNDVFNLPTGICEAIDRTNTHGSIIYLVQLLGSNSYIGKAFYIKTNRELSLIPHQGSYIVYEPLTLKCIESAQYTQGRVKSVNTWVFERLN
jgi:hypothetical protein